jgi:hypothetical protein
MSLEWNDLDPRTWPGAVKQKLDEWTKESDSEKAKRDQLNQQGAAAGAFADQGQAGYGQLGTEAADSRKYLRDVIAGRESIAGEQLRQGLQQNLASQRSMAASAAPQNAAMAQRNAAMNMGRASMGMTGQAALAGIQERRAAQEALMQSIMAQRGQDMQVALGSRDNAIRAHGGVTPEKSLFERLLPAGQAAATMIAMSDRRLKTNIEPGDNDANTAIERLRAHAFDYKDTKHGKGRQLGVMAQDLEKAGLGHAVIETRDGKAVDAAKAATSSLALVAALGRRVADLERKDGPLQKRESARAALREAVAR